MANTVKDLSVSSLNTVYFKPKLQIFASSVLDFSSL